MTKQEQIEEMLLAVPQTIVAYDGNPKGQHLYVEQRRQIAEALYEAGYRREATITSDFIKMVQRHAKIDLLKELIDGYGRDYISPVGLEKYKVVRVLKEIIEEIQNAEDKS